ncbi:unnamed protein product [Sphenostylis stenocarpa]|uniref:Uncharacterized protein n=1 Tax=Sphenostylis stenocarpa TaxID=92480 RepID=A0AA86S2U1_9FABA|nr:unnamed protein product [Sphenostylis stenocarpa]
MRENECRGITAKLQLVWMSHLVGLPTPSWESSHGNLAKALVSWFLDRGHRVRLASQSSEHLWLSTVEGPQASALPIR